MKRRCAANRYNFAMSEFSKPPVDDAANAAAPVPRPLRAIQPLPDLLISQIAAGADGVAVISALSGSRDPAAAARTLREIVDAMLAKRGT